MKILRLFVRVVDRLSDLAGVAASVLVPVMVLIIAYEVAARYIFRQPTVWVFDTAIFIFGYVGMLGGAYVLKRRNHINVDVFHGRLSARGRAVVDAVTAPLVFFFLFLMIVYGWDSAIAGIGRGIRRPTEWAPPLGHFMLLIPAGAGLLLLQGLANWVRDLHRALTGRELDA